MSAEAGMLWLPRACAFTCSIDFSFTLSVPEASQYWLSSSTAFTHSCPVFVCSLWCKHFGVGCLRTSWSPILNEATFLDSFFVNKLPIACGCSGFEGKMEWERGVEKHITASLSSASTGQAAPWKALRVGRCLDSEAECWDGVASELEELLEQMCTSGYGAIWAIKSTGLEPLIIFKSKELIPTQDIQDDSTAEFLFCLHLEGY